MSQPKFKTDELIIATVASLEKWKKIKEWETNSKCGFCKLIASKGIRVSMSSEPGYPELAICFKPCPVGKICYANVKFWDDILLNDRRKFNPGKYKYQQRRIQKNIDWLNEYLKELLK